MSVNFTNQASTVNSLKGELTEVDALELTQLTKADRKVDGELTLKLTGSEESSFAQPIRSAVGPDVQVMEGGFRETGEFRLVAGAADQVKAGKLLIGCMVDQIGSLLWSLVRSGNWLPTIPRVC